MADRSNKTKRDQGPLDLATKRSQGRMFSVVKGRLQGMEKTEPACMEDAHLHIICQGDKEA